MTNPETKFSITVQIVLIIPFFYRSFKLPELCVPLYSVSWLDLIESKGEQKIKVSKIEAKEINYTKTKRQTIVHNFFFIFFCLLRRWITDRNMYFINFCLVSRS